MLDKTSNGIMFAVIGFGGFLGIGEKYHAIPWSVLDYEKSRGGYVVPFTKEQLEAAPPIRSTSSPAVTARRRATLPTNITRSSRTGRLRLGRELRRIGGGASRCR